MVKVAVILSGCGHMDGSEIREAVLTLLALDRHDVEIQCFAPNFNQHDVVNHLTGKVMDESRNVLVEAARIARGNIKDLKEVNVDDFDALLIPGGFGVAKNLSDLAIKGADAKAIDDFKNVVIGFLKNKKPIGAICISPAVLVAAIKNEYKAIVTIGDDNDGLITAIGAVHQPCATENFVYDETNNIATCSAYMRGDARLADVASGIEKVVAKVLEKV